MAIQTPLPVGAATEETLSGVATEQTVKQSATDPSDGATLIVINMAILRELRLMNILLAQGFNIRISDITLIRDDPGLMN